jgi:hypothetical protein
MATVGHKLHVALMFNIKAPSNGEVDKAEQRLGIDLSRICPPVPLDLHIDLQGHGSQSVVALALRWM